MTVAVNYDALGTWATVVAVLIALFGPPVHEWYRIRRRQPDVRIHHKQYVQIPPAGFTQSIEIDIKNAEDRERAENVEVYINVERDPPLKYISYVPAPFTRGMLLIDGQRVSSINPGFTRSVVLATLIGQRRYFTDQECGRWKFIPERGGDPKMVELVKTNVCYRVSIVVTGSNFNAAYFYGEGCVQKVANPLDDEVYAFTWTKKLAPG